MRPAHRLALAGALVLAALAGGGRVASRDGVTEARAPRPEPSTSSDSSAPGSTNEPVRGVDPVAEARELSAVRPFADRDSTDASAARRDLASLAPPVVLENPQLPLGAALRLAGRDPGGPRALELWRVVGERSARIALGRSRPDGTLAFPPIALPAGVVELVAAPRGSGPEGAGASTPVRLARDPAAPQISRAGSDRLRIEPAEPAGDLLLARSDDLALPPERIAVRADRDGSAAPIELTPVAGESLRVAHELPDGRRSPWRVVAVGSLPQPEQETEHDSNPPVPR